MPEGILGDKTKFVCGTCPSGPGAPSRDTGTPGLVPDLELGQRVRARVRGRVHRGQALPRGQKQEAKLTPWHPGAGQ